MQSGERASVVARAGARALSDWLNQDFCGDFQITVQLANHVQRQGAARRDDS